MPERRQSFRREPIVIVLDDEREVLVAPVPWEQRGDFGNELMRQNAEVINEAIKIWIDPDSGIPQLEAKLQEKFTDAGILLRLGLPEGAYDEIKSWPLYSNQVTDILLAILEVNQLENLRPMIDPNSQAPTQLTGMLSSLLAGATENTGQETASGGDSSSPVSIDTPSSNSPTPSSEAS